MAALYRTDPPPQPTVLLQPNIPASDASSTQATATPAVVAATAAVPPMPTTGSDPDAKTGPHEWLVGVSVLGVIAISIIAVLVFKDGNYKTATPRPIPEGLTIFAIFFVAAQGIERLLEPIASLFTSAEDDLKAAEKQVEDAKKAAGAEQIQNLRNMLGGQPTTEDAKKVELQHELDGAATKVAALRRSKNDRKVVFWALASSVAIVASASMQLYLLRTVGISSAPRYHEVLATGLIVGAGTKPLHDLVTLISAKADSAKSSSDSK